MLIGLSGKAGAGKDAVGSMLVGTSFKRMAFADRLKKIVKDLFALDEETMYSQEGKEAVDPRWGRSPRQILQMVGRGMREVHPSIWTRHVLDQVDQFPNVVITDCRFASELEEIRAQGGYIVRINRPGAGSATGAEDLSETALDSYDGFDYIIDNTGDLRDLQREVAVMLEHLRWRHAQRSRVQENQ